MYKYIYIIYYIYIYVYIYTYLYIYIYINTNRHTPHTHIYLFIYLFIYEYLNRIRTSVIMYNIYNKNWYQCLSCGLTKVQNLKILRSFKQRKNRWEKNWTVKTWNTLKKRQYEIAGKTAASIRVRIRSIRITGLIVK